MGTLAQDLRYGLRLLRKNPGFTTVAVLTLALGIGANTAIFSVVNAVLLRSLPYPEASRLITIDGGQSRPDLADLQAASHKLASLGGFAQWHFDLIGTGEPEQVKADLVSLDFFPTLGIDAALGRTFSSNDDQFGGEPVVVVSHRFWQQRLGGDPHAIGRTLNLTAKNYTIIGVMPATFKLPRGQAEMWVPFRVGYPEAANQRGVHFQYAIARLASGATIAQAQDEMNAAAVHLAQLYPEENRDRKFALISLQERVVRNVRRTLLVLLGAVGFVLLIASANFANLLLARASARRPEAQIRMALGAAPARLIRQLLTESMLLALIGGAAGLAVGYAALQALLQAKPKQLPTLAGAGLDARVLAFALFIALLTGCLFGLFPALHVMLTARRTGINEKSTTARHTDSSSLVRQTLIVGEIALSMTLLCGSGLLIRSLLRVQEVSPGLNPSGVLTAQLWLPETRYHDIAPQDRLLTDVVQNLEHVPGIQSVSLATELPFSGQRLSHEFVIAGRPPMPEGSEPDTDTNLVSPAYFQTLQIPLIAGRVFTDGDRTSSPPVAVINQSMAKQYWPGQDPVGAQVRYARENPAVWMTVVGVVGDVKADGLDQEPGPAMYTSIFQKRESWRRWATLVVRSAGPEPMQLGPDLKRQVRALDSQLPIVQMQPMTGLLDDSLAERRFNTFLLGTFAAVSVLLSMIGVYGVISYIVSQRTREFGIRMALGALRSDLLFGVLAEGMLSVAFGLSLGLLTAFALTRVLAGLLFGVSSRDPLTFAATAACLLVVALLASYVPARRAGTVDPMVALRDE
jgi:putative ABC transport system permease protein